MMLAAVRSELARTRRRSYLLGWLGLSAVFSVLVNVFVYQSASGSSAAPPKAGPGGNFPSVTQLQAAHGLIAPLGSVSRLVGVITLSYWAVTAATDYQSGLIRLLVQAQPRRLYLLGGKIAALAVWTAGVATLCVTITSLLAEPLAGGSHISTGHWTHHVAALVLSGWLDTYLALLVWGVIGLVLAATTRSSVVAIAGGLGYVLLGESLISVVASGAAKWLPGSILSTLAGGGSTDVAFSVAVALALSYAATGVGATSLILTRRDITD